MRNRRMVGAGMVALLAGFRAGSVDPNHRP
jgi:hypothetical protein